MSTEALLSKNKMNTNKFGYYSLSLLLILSACQREEDIVNIPDNIFMATLIENGVDIDGDGLISYAEAEVRTYLNISNRGISDLTGIQAFYNLDTLMCF